MLQSTALFASALSGTTMLICLLAMLRIRNDVNVAWTLLDNEMDKFKEITDDLWHDMQTISRFKDVTRHKRQYGSSSENSPAYDGDASGYGSKTKQADSYGGADSGSQYSGSSAPAGKSESASDKRQIFSVDDNNALQPAAGEEESLPPGGKPTKDQCKCDKENKCLAGLPGPKGMPGRAGANGIPGEDGQSGSDALDALPPRKFNHCYTCPRGQPGISGNAGKVGLKGIGGSKGRNGIPGRDGQPGPPGEPGPDGLPGRDGDTGPTGPKGSDAHKLIGQPGAKGKVGPAGPSGKQGKKGGEGQTGKAGQRGLPGNLGKPGPAGSPGKIGPEGDLGKPGKDGEYCPCPPKRSMKQVLTASPESYGSSSIYRS